MARWSFANVLNATPETRKLWQFTPGSNQFTLAREYTARNGEGIPGNLAGKDWQSLWSPKLNIAWLPADKVFLRVLQLPQADFAETLSMVDLQLEKISPLPTAQTVWTIEILPKQEQNLQTVIVVIVPRNLVEEFLGQLEGQGYLADRLELPVLDQLLATQIGDDGVWIYPGDVPNSPCLVAWWYGGVLRNLALLSWTNGVDEQRLKEQLSQMAWAGELEGWLTSQPKWHLVAGPDVAAVWQPMLENIAGESVIVTEPMPAQQLAALSARRAFQAPAAANLLPVEYSTRYRQQYIDRLWMRGLLAVGGVYIFLVIVYFSFVMFLNYRLNNVKIEVAGLSQQYTNAIQQEERVRVLQEQSNLKFAALDTWEMIARLLPPEVTLTSFNFQKGRSVMLSGTVAQSDLGKLVDYYDTIGKSAVNDLPLKVGQLNTPAARVNSAGVPTIYWSFTISLGDLATTKK